MREESHLFKRTESGELDSTWKLEDLSDGLRHSSGKGPSLGELKGWAGCGGLATGRGQNSVLTPRQQSGVHRTHGEACVLATAHTHEGGSDRG